MAQVNLLVLDLHLEMGGKVNKGIRMNKNEQDKTRAVFLSLTQIQMLIGDGKLFRAMADSENP